MLHRKNHMRTLAIQNGRHFVDAATRRPRCCSNAECRYGTRTTSATATPLKCASHNANTTFADSVGDNSIATGTRKDGVVEGVWMFCRHGDRTPTRPLTPEHRRDEEAAFWMTKLPSPDSATVFESFSKYFPVVKLKGGGVGKNAGVACPATFIDVSRNPFGFLTSKGLQQLSNNGRLFFNRYNKNAHHLPHCKEWKSASDFLSVWDVQVYSTNYLRTIMSVQSFLDGMFGTLCYGPSVNLDPLNGVSTIPDRLYDSAITKEERIPCTQPDYSAISALGDKNEHLVTIKVRALRNDPLNAFDRNPDLIAELVTEVTSSNDFFMRDSNAAPLAARLANILPGLVRRRPNHALGARTPSGINWVEAADHFVCRASHDVYLSKYSDFETDEIEQTLLAMSYPTLAHLSWRFRQWYQHDRLLAVIAAPPLREITNQILFTPHLGIHERRPFVVYSCHDITILGLLYAIGADFLATDCKSNEDLNPSKVSGSWQFWPPYGCNLVFELVRLRDGPPGPDSHAVRVLLNGSPVRSVSASKARHLQGWSEGMLLVDEFEEVVSKLEQAGGHDYASLLAMT